MLIASKIKIAVLTKGKSTLTSLKILRHGNTSIICDIFICEKLSAPLVHDFKISCHLKKNRNT